MLPPPPPASVCQAARRHPPQPHPRARVPPYVPERSPFVTPISSEKTTSWRVAVKKPPSIRTYAT